MSAITAKASRKMKKYAVLTREPRCFLGSFDFSWEQRKLSEITDKVTEKNAGLQYVETFTNSAEFGIISQRDFFDHDIAKLGSLDGYYIVKNEDFVYNPRISTSAPVGPINRNKLGRTGVMSPLYTVFRPHDIDTTYLEYFFKCGYWHSFMNFNGDSGARSDRFSIRDNVFFQMPIPIPDIDEQRKIGELLTCLDNLITLHQRKCANLCSPSQVVFSLLFATSTFSWEQRKLTEFVEFFSGLTYTPNDVQENGTLVLRSSNVSNGEVVDADNIYVNPQVVNSENVKVGDIVVVVRNGSRSLIGKHAQIKAFMPNTVIGAFMTGIRSECPEFTNALLNTSRFEEEIAMNMGATINQITGYMFSKMEFKVPCLDEQKKIGEYFEKLDNLITLHQRECISFTGRADRLILTANKKRTTSSWEQRKFGEITSKYEDPVPTPHDGYYRLGIRSHAKGTFHSYVAKGQELETAQMHRVAAGNFIVNITFGWEHAVAITDKNDAGKLVSHRFPQFSFAEGMVPEFFRYVIVDEKFRHHLWLASPGGAGRNRVLKLDEMLNYLMRFPSRDEQIKIAEFFRHLDNLITLHQRKPFLMKWRTSDANRNQTNRLVL